MFGSLKTPLSALLRPSPFASSSRVTLAAFAPIQSSQPIQSTGLGQVRWKSVLAPRRMKYKKAQKGRVGIPTGGSLKGSSLEHAPFGLRLLTPARLTAAQLTSAQVAIKRRIKQVKGAECFLRVFPDIAVCVKGNETRMGKGKGSFEYWACRVPVGRVVFEVGGGGIREEIARQALRLAQVKLPAQSEFITATSSPRLGSLTSPSLTRPPAAMPAPAHLLDMDSRDEGKAPALVLAEEERRVEGLEDVTRGMQGLDLGKEEARA